MKMAKLPFSMAVITNNSGIVRDAGFISGMARTYQDESKTHMDNYR